MTFGTEVDFSNNIAFLLRMCPPLVVGMRLVPDTSSEPLSLVCSKKAAMRSLGASRLGLADLWQVSPHSVKHHATVGRIVYDLTEAIPSDLRTSPVTSSSSSSSSSKSGPIQDEACLGGACGATSSVPFRTTIERALPRTGHQRR
jgi:hypothetical protein